MKPTSIATVQVLLCVVLAGPQALEEAGVSNRLHTVPSGGHGTFSLERFQVAAEVILDLLKAHGLR